jgi:hypothetical protein
MQQPGVNAAGGEAGGSKESSDAHSASSSQKVRPDGSGAQKPGNGSFTIRLYNVVKCYSNLFVSLIQVSAFRGRTINGGTKCLFLAVQLAPLPRVRLDLLRQGRHRHIVRPAVAATHIHMLVGLRKAEVVAITTIITIRPRLHPPPHSGLRIRINSLIRDQAAVIKMLNRCQDRVVLLIRRLHRPHSRIRSNLEYNISNNSFIRSTRLLRYCWCPNAV